MSALIRAKAENGPKFGGEYRARARLLVPMYDLRRYGANRSFFFFFFFFSFFSFFPLAKLIYLALTAKKV